jgi:hypothetical protein
MARGAVKWTK